MKRIIYLLSTIAAIFAFTACEDVPEPYVLNTNGTTTVLLNETFASSLGKFNSKSANGTLQWKNDYSSAVITGFQDFDGNGVKENQAGETYLVSPVVHLEEVDSAFVSFSQAINYEKQTINDDHKLLISDNYNNDVTTTTWTEIPISFNGVGGSFTFVDQEVQIPSNYIGKAVNLALKHIAHDSYSSTWEVKNFRVVKGVAGKQEPIGPSIIDGEATGSGTLEDPYNSVAVINYVNSLGSDVESPTDVYVKGKVVSIVEQYGTQYGNATFYISDDGTETNQFQVYRALYLGNKKYTSGETLNVGDSVIICGKVVNFKGNTPETVVGKAFLYSLNGETGGYTPDPTPSGEAKGSGTLEDPYNSVAVINYINTLDKDVESPNDVYIKGKVVSIVEQYGTQYGNATFYISDDGTTANQFQVYRALYLGNEKYTGGTQLKVGDEVIVCGKVVLFKGNTPETVVGKAYLYSLNGETEANSDNPDTPDVPQPTGDNLIANGDFEVWSGNEPVYWASTTTASTKGILSQSNEAHGGSYSVCVAGKTSGNQRIAYKEITLKAGTYTMSFYAKAATSTGGSVRPGYVPITDGKVGSYAYGDYVNDLNTSEWTAVTHQFTLDAETMVNLVIMNPKNPGADVLIDDFELTTSDGGLAGGSDEPEVDPNDPNDTSIPYGILFTKSTAGWTIQNIDLGGLSYVWKQDTKYGMKASAFNKTNYATEALFVSPVFDIPEDGPVYMSMSHALNFLNGNPREDYVKVEVKLANGVTEELDGINWPEGTSYDFVDAIIMLNKYYGESIQFIFHYKSTEQCAPTWEIDSFEIHH